MGNGKGIEGLEEIWTIFKEMTNFEGAVNKLNIKKGGLLSLLFLGHKLVYKCVDRSKWSFFTKAEGPTFFENLLSEVCSHFSEVPALLYDLSPYLSYLSPSALNKLASSLQTIASTKSSDPLR